MHKEILSNSQIKLLPLAKRFADDFILVGGTAIALYLGHRKSIDFDLFTTKKLNHDKIKTIVSKNYAIEATLVENSTELTVVVEDVKLTFLEYPFEIEGETKFEDIFALTSLDTLAAMKAYALGRRAKWKDYVDLYYIFKQFGMKNTLAKAHTIFGNEFNEKLFRTQLSYFEDIDRTEKVQFMDGFEVADDQIKENLVEFSL